MEHDKLEVIWGHRLLDEGFLAIPNILVRNYRKLGIEHGEFGFICTVLTYKHDTNDPYPSQETLAKHLNCSTRQIQKWIDSLYHKGLLLIGQRKHPTKKSWNTNVYNFRPLIEKTLALVGEEPLPKQEDDYDVIYRKAPSEPEVQTEPEVPYEPEVRTEESEPEVRTDHEPEVRNTGPEVRENRSTEKISEYNLPDPTELTANLAHKLQQIFSPQSYDTWYGDMEVLGLSEGVLFVELGYAFAAKYAQEKHARTFIEVMRELGYEVTTVKFVSKS